METTVRKPDFAARVRKRMKQTNAVRVAMFVLFALYAFSMIYALLWAALNSLKDPVEYMLNKNAFPKQWLFANYAEAFRLLEANDTNLFVMLFNSVWMTLGRSLVSLACITFAGYLFSKYKFIGRNFIYAVLIGTMMLPLYGTGASQMKLIHALGLYDSPLYPLIISASMQGSLLLIMRSFFDGISWEYAEAAKIDGAGHYRILFQVMLPLAKPCVSSIFILMLITGWNDYQMPLYYLPSYPTIQTGLYLYAETAKFNINYPVYFAGVILTCIPTLTVYVFAQDKIMNSVSMGGLKE